MPRSAWECGQISSYVHASTPTGKHRSYGSATKPALNRKSRKNSKKNDSATENHQFLKKRFWSLEVSSERKGSDRQLQSARSLWVSVTLTAVFRWMECSCSIFEVPLPFIHRGFASRSQCRIKISMLPLAPPGNAGSLFKMHLKYCKSLSKPSQGPGNGGGETSKMQSIIRLEHFCSVHL